jgi:hypothetical protein
MVAVEHQAGPELVTFRGSGPPPPAMAEVLPHLLQGMVGHGTVRYPPRPPAQTKIAVAGPQRRVQETHFAYQADMTGACGENPLQRPSKPTGGEVQAVAGQDQVKGGRRGEGKLLQGAGVNRQVRSLPPPGRLLEQGPHPPGGLQGHHFTALLPQRQGQDAATGPDVHDPPARSHQGLKVLQNPPVI